MTAKLKLDPPIGLGDDIQRVIKVLVRKLGGKVQITAADLYDDVGLLVVTMAPGQSGYWIEVRSDECPQGGSHTYAELLEKGKIVVVCTKCGKRG